MRRALQRIVPLLESTCTEQVRCFRSTQCAAASAGEVPTPRMPVRHPRVQQPPEAGASVATASVAPSGTAASAPEAANSGAVAQSALAGATAAQQQFQAAQAVTSGMLFPWERRQFDGSPGGLKTWEKLYWGVFVTCISLYLFSRIAAPSSTEDTKAVDEEKEAKKILVARKLLAGADFNAGDATVFEGWTPAEIQDFISKHTHGASTADPFEGLDPQEIQNMVAEWQE